MYYEDCFHLKLVMIVIYLSQPSQPLPTHCTPSNTPSHGTPHTSSLRILPHPSSHTHSSSPHNPLHTPHTHNPHHTPHILITHTHNPHHTPHTIQCMVGVVPLGTGNDMARVLGWGAQATDEEKIPQILAEMEQSSFKLLDRWSVHFSPQQNLNISHILGAHSVSINYSGTAHPYCALCELTGKGSY